MANNIADAAAAFTPHILEPGDSYGADTIAAGDYGVKVGDVVIYGSPTELREFAHHIVARMDKIESAEANLVSYLAENWAYIADRPDVPAKPPADLDEALAIYSQARAHEDLFTEPITNEAATCADCESLGAECPFHGPGVTAESRARAIRAALSTPTRNGVLVEVTGVAALFTGDELDALVITAAEAVNGDVDGLSERQTELAGRAYRAMNEEPSQAAG